MMSRHVILPLRVGVHLLCLAPLIWLVRFCISARILLNADPVQFVLHFTGDWAISLLLASLAVSLLAKLAAMASLPIPWHRLTGFYAFCYATVHVAIYFLIYSGYDFMAALANFHTGHPDALLTEWNAVSPLVFEDLRQRPLLDLGLVGWVLLLGAVIPSPAFLRRAGGGKNGQHPRYLLSAAALAAVLHGWWFVKASVAMAEVAPSAFRICLTPQAACFRIATRDWFTTVRAENHSGPAGCPPGGWD
jgi:sulfoxide reductase heme-binding subunit YedZ